jgi:hypothetical protein
VQPVILFLCLNQDLPKTNGSRTFPDIAVILAGFPANPPAAMGGLKGEILIAGCPTNEIQTNCKG